MTNQKERKLLRRLKRERNGALKRSGKLLQLQSGPVRGRPSRAQYFPLLVLRVDVFLPLAAAGAASFLTAGFTGVVFSGAERLGPPLAAAFPTAGFSGRESSGFDRLDALLVVSLATMASSGDDSLDAGRLDPLLLCFLTAGVWGFFAAGAFFTGVALGGGVGFFVAADCFLHSRLTGDAAFLTGDAAFLTGDAAFFTGDAAFLTGDFFARERPRPLAFDLLELRDFLAAGGRGALGGGLFFEDFLKAI